MKYLQLSRWMGCLLKKILKTETRSYFSAKNVKNGQPTMTGFPARVTSTYLADRAVLQIMTQPVSKVSGLTTL